MSKHSSQDTLFLKQTLALAQKGLGWTNPNPLVGAILVKDGKIIGQGYHHRVGQAHAEVEALRSTKQAGHSNVGATLYLNLEPCSFQGRQPPCTPALIAAGIKRVVICTLDPNPRVNGRGVRQLRQAGMRVDLGLLEKEAKILNEAFFTFHKTKRPFVAIKYASSLDGKIATRTHDSKWITNDSARAYARSLRATYQAILVGIETVLQDNPHLGSRQTGNPDPLRIILDDRLRIPLRSLVLRDKNVLIITSQRASAHKKKALLKKGITVIQQSGSRISLPQLMKELYNREIVSVLVEGGGSVLGSFIDQCLADKAYIFQAPLIIGGEDAISAVRGQGSNTVASACHLKNISRLEFGDNLLTTGYTDW